MKKLYHYSSAFLFGTFALALGILFIFADPEILQEFYFQLIAVFIVAFGMIRFTMSIGDSKKSKYYYFDLIEGIIGMLVGVIFANFMRYLVVDIVLASIYFLVPIVRFFTTTHHLNQFVIDALKYFFGVCILCSSRSFYPTFFLVVGICHIAFAITIITIKIITTIKKRGNSFEKNN